jgi:hypothetical protein
MKTGKHLTTTRTCLLCLTVLLVSPAIFAGDEDMSPNAYHIFDPETGYMITVESVPDGQIAPTGADSNKPVPSLGNQTETARDSQSWLYLIAAMLVVAGFAAWKRKNEKTTSGDS